MSLQKWQLKILSIDLPMDPSQKQWGITGLQEPIGLSTEMLSEATLKTICSDNPNGSAHFLLITICDIFLKSNVTIIILHWCKVCCRDPPVSKISWSRVCWAWMKSPSSVPLLFPAPQWKRQHLTMNLWWANLQVSPLWSCQVTERWSSCLFHSPCTISQHFSEEFPSPC